jgi:hypothetical protein
MTMLSQAELDALRADIETLTLPGTAIIQRATEANDGYGEAVKTWAAVGTVVCRIDPIGSMRTSGGNLIALQEKGKAYYQFSTIWDADMNDGDRVVSGGLTYELIQLHENHDLRAVKRAILVRVG